MKILIVGHHIYERSERIKLWKFIVENYNPRVALFVGHPLPKTLYPQTTLILFYRNGQSKRIEIYRHGNLRFFSYFIDLLFTLPFVFLLGPRWDFYFGVNEVYTALGLLLRSLFLVKRTVFWATDYFPNYSSNPLLNWIYKWLNKTCSIFCDFSWNVSNRMIREVRGTRKGKHLLVPHPIWKDEISLLPQQQIEKTTLIYIGPFGGEFALVLEAMAYLRDEIPSIKLIVASYEPLPLKFKEAIEKLRLGRNIKFLGFIQSDEELDEVVKKCRVGLAPYDPNSFKRYADPGRIKAYMAKGVPVITTEATELGELLGERKAGLVINYDAKELASAIKNLINDDALWKTCRENALKLLLEKYEVNKVFGQAFEQMNLQKGLNKCSKMYYKSSTH